MNIDLIKVPESKPPITQTLRSTERVPRYALERLRKTATLAIAALLLLLCGSRANATVLAGWDMAGVGSFGPSPFTPGTAAGNLTIVGLTRGSGVATSGSPAANAWGGVGWQGGSEAASISGNYYATFTITANAGYKVSFSDIPAYNVRRSGTGPTTGIWQYQVGAGTFTDIGSPITWGSNTSATGNGQALIDLSGISALQNVPAGTTVTFRIVNWSGGSAGTWYINNTAASPDLAVEGSVDPADVAPVAPVANDPTGITSIGFIANWSPSGGAGGYQLDVSTDSGFGSFVSGYNNLDVGNVMSASVTGLSANTTYYYRVRAYNSSGTSDNSNVESATTTGTVAATQMTVTLPGQSSANTGTPTAQTAGTPFNVTLTAVLSDGVTVDTTYGGTRSITFSGPSGSPVYPATVTFTSGVGTASVTLNTAETTTISATDTLLAPIASSSFTVNAATYTWTATGGSASWTDATNWTPNRTAPGPSDVLLFNQGGNSTATGVPSQTIGSLQVSANTAITLQAGAINTLTIAGGANALSVGTGSALNVSGGSALTLSLPTGSSGTISGSMDFGGGAHKLLAADASGVTFQTGSTFTADTGFSSNAFGTANFNSVVFGSGSAYIQKAGANPFGASAPSAVVVFQAGSLYSIQANLAPSLSGRTYADLEINAAAYNQTSTGGNSLSINNLTVTAGAPNFNLTGGINILGNVTVQGGQSLTFAPLSAGAVNFSGTSPQTISGGGTLSFGASSVVSIASGSTVLVQSPVTTAGGTSITVNGTLGGSSSITGAGSVSVSGTGTLSPGASIGTLTFDTAPVLGGVTYMQLDRSATPNADEVALTGGTFNYGGTLVVTNIGATLANGDTFTLFAASGFGGWFDSLTFPVIGGGLNLDTNALATTGVLRVYSFTATGPLPLPVSENVAATLLVATVLADTTGGRGTLALASVSGASHGSLGTNATTITYTPNAGYTGSDSFVCAVLDTNNAVANVTVQVTVGGGGGGNTSRLAIQQAGSSFTVTITGTPGVSYQLQSSTNVAATTWPAVGGPFTMPPAGSTNMTVTPSGAKGFYRTALP